MKREEKEKDNFSKIGKKYIPLSKAAKIYGCTPEHLNLMSRQGKLKAIKLGRNWFTTKKWLRDYKKFVNNITKHEKKAERKKLYLISNTKTIEPYKIKDYLKRFFRNTLVFTLASFILIVLFSSIYIDKAEGLVSKSKDLVSIFDWSSGPSIIQEYAENIGSAYSNIFKLTKDLDKSLVFDYANFIEDSFNNISRQAEEGADEIVKLAKNLKINFGKQKIAKEQKRFRPDLFDFRGAANVFEDIKYAVDIDVSIDINGKFADIGKPELVKQEFRPTLLKQVGAFFVFFFESLFDSFKQVSQDIGEFHQKLVKKKDVVDSANQAPLSGAIEQVSSSEAGQISIPEQESKTEVVE